MKYSRIIVLGFMLLTLGMTSCKDDKKPSAPVTPPAQVTQVKLPKFERDSAFFNLTDI